VQLEKLKVFQEKITSDSSSYLESHPEFQKLIDNFVSAVITHKPNDIIKFGSFYFNKLSATTKYGHCPIIISGPSGVGKRTLINMLISKFPYFGFSVSNTTRPKRNDEEDGLYYNFVSKLAMEEGIENKEYIEYTKIQNFLYGTTYEAVEQVIQ
jgi:Cdc6-like AAA superfamily ATPase